jgi:hypothetical protein
MGTAKKGLAIVLGLGGKPPKVEEHDDHESDPDMSSEDVDGNEAKKNAAQGVLDATESKDAEKLSDALSTFVDLCIHCKEEPEEEDTDEDEG